MSRTRTPLLAALFMLGGTGAALAAGGDVGGVDPLEPVGAGLLVQLADQVAGGGEHDRLTARATVATPGLEDFLGHGALVPDVDAPTVEVEAQGFMVSIA